MRNNFLLIFLMLPALQACSPARDTGDSPPAPGTMRVLSVELAEDSAACSLLPNGAFEEWYGGLPAPTGFRAPGAASESTLLRDTKSGHLGATGYTARQAWTGPGTGAAPSDSFGATVNLQPKTRYELGVIASASPGMRAGVGAYEVDADGQVRPLARTILEIGGEAPARYSGTFETAPGGAVILASHAVPGSTLPGSVTWSAWSVQEATESAAPINIADAPARRLLVNNALDQVRSQVALYGGAESWTKAMEPSLERVNRVLRGDVAKGGSVPGYGQFVFSTAELEWYRDAADPTRNEKGALSPARAAILRCERVLNARGIQLLVVPVPARVHLYLDRLFPADAPAPASFAPHTHLIESLLAGDVLTMDAAPALLDLKAKGAPVYWRADPDAPSATLHAIADLVAPVLESLGAAAPKGARREYTLKVETVPLDQRLVSGLQPEYQKKIEKEVHLVQSVREKSGELFTPATEGPVLAVGSLAVLHQVRGASFAARLSMALGFPVTLLLQNLPDTELPAYLAGGEAPELASARVVVFCLPEQVFSRDGWQ